MVRNNSGRLGWKVKLTPSQIRNKIAVEIWVDKYEVDYALLDTKEEKINFLKEILEKNREKGGSRNKESQKALQVFIIKKLKNARDQQANALTVKGQKSPEPIQKNNSDSEPGSTKQIHNEKINWQGKQTQLVYVWEKLCDFLEVPVPANIFPKVNTTEQFLSGPPEVSAKTRT